MRYMFAYCYNLKNLNLSSFQALNGCNSSYMFMGCTNLNYINLCNFDLMNVKKNNIFFGCNNLINIDYLNKTKDNYNEIKLIINNKYIASKDIINIFFVKNNEPRISIIIPDNAIIADLLFKYYLKKGYNDRLKFIYNASDLINLDKAINQMMISNSIISVLD